MTSREIILGRIREALQISAPPPGAHGGHSSPPSEAEASRHIPQWLPPVGATFEDQVALFAKNSAELRTDFRPVDGSPLAGLREIAGAEGWKKLAAHHADLTDEALGALGLPVLFTDDGYDRSAMESCDAGVTTCEALVAQTGSVLVSSRNSGGRALSVLPPHHVVLARKSQLVADLPAAFALLHEKYRGDFPSMLSFITGPSRTGDIERILVLGAHGPRKLTVLLVND